MVTRTVFEGMAPVWHIVFYLLSTISTAFFLYGSLRLIRKYRLTKKSVPKFNIGRMMKIVFTHIWIGRGNGIIGFAHAGVFYGFLILLAGTTILAIQEQITKPLGFEFWHDGFYKGYSLFLDVFGAFMMVGLVIFCLHRASEPAQQDYTRVDGKEVSKKRARYKFDHWVFLWSLLFIGASGFILEALRIAINLPSFEIWSPVGYLSAKALQTIGISGATADSARMFFWWIHTIVALFFVAAIPFTKAVHMLTGPISIATQDLSVSKTLPDEPATGYETFADFTLNHKLSLDSCTKCGKCHDVCPARVSSMPLSPRDLILDLREAQTEGFSSTLAGNKIKEETLWSCMQCNACVDICPVGIEHVPIINLLRRNLVETGKLETGLKSVLNGIMSNGNSFSEPKRKRAKWADDLGFEILDARETAVDVLWFVGDYASFDARNQRNTRALAKLLYEADVKVGILFSSEKTAGNDVRRVGEEGLFQSLAQENLETLSNCNFKTLLTSDPHTFNTLRNEYPKLGGKWTKEQVIHHSVFLLDLLNTDKLVVTNPLNKRATYHDPCALGRFNGIFDQPRELITKTGVEIVEMPRNKLNSFCCGAGGGRIWMKEIAPTGSKRPSESRIDEAISLGNLDYFVVACPKDVVMYEDAIKSTNNSDNIELREISELVLEATGFLPLNNLSAIPVAI